MTTTAPVELPDTASGVLAAARSRRAVADRAEAELLELAVQWAVIHPAETVDDAESYRLRGGGEAPVGLAGPGAPLVAEFCVAEFAAAVGLGTEAGKYYLGHALELRYRLPRLWGRVTTGALAPWKARRVADQTIGRALNVEAAAFVDTHVAPVAGRIRPAQLDRLVDEAVARCMPETAEAERRRASDSRRFDIDHDQVSFAGTSLVSGELDLADALDLDDAIRGIAGQLADLGCAESLDVRRSLAAGELARRQLTLDLVPEVEVRAQRASKPPVRKTVLHLHLTEAALTGGEGVGRCENTRSPVTVETIREWCGHPDTDLVVKPVIDLADHVHVDAYEVPDRIAEQVALRDHACVFPHCTRPARRLRPNGHGCDTDHVRPYDPGGPPGQTCTCRLAPLCRTHHRLKTHGSWTYTAIEPGTYLWTSPHGHQYLRDHTGTRDVSVDRRPPPRD
ncbi:HNH endonuclease signature motif containing protein [Nocardioides sp. GXQ0305]|uniref:HNH endonuclease signature motif containing protein n=1 Tax=Nocardioides sp. GXQ0305 TaxID=3423912 RepID=UPI003D7E56BB